MSILHITNGDAAAALLRNFDPGSEVLPWRDVLHEGPVPSGLGLEELSEVRALFIDAVGWEEYGLARESFAARDSVIRNHHQFNEIALWFEWDLYDQLQLIQIVDFLVSEHRALADVTVVNCPGYLSELTLEQLERVADDFTLLSEGAAIDAAQAWSAFRDSTPSALCELIESRTVGGDALPFLHAALQRALEEYPSVQNGLSRCEHNILEALQRGPLPVCELFVAAHHKLEERHFLGDLVFRTQLQRLECGEQPLVGTIFGDSDRMEITELGRAVYRGEVDWLSLGARERWIGGVSVSAIQPSARWDRLAGRLVIP